MDALSLLLNRHSQPRLVAPAPEGEALENILQAALRAPDHGMLTPWRYVVCRGEGLTRLGEVYAQAAQQGDYTERDISRAPTLPLRAPMVIVAISSYTEHQKVPWVEQVASAACGVHAMQLAALAQGYAGIWRTGPYARDPLVKAAFDLRDEDEIVGFLYLGTAEYETSAKPARNIADFVSFWQ
ncbi:NAD(P)H nitroreductase [Aestuariibacter halophilus]|uniref:Putative NAD(P)H nitroreductase n=1 Tax=Fluctibacter halophilus TaxID=226011 RepID=A0ABS8G4K1_9ALTE|nr:NAD(P)H nitroreductase [Aestuariibacter halophilus]MCC2615413.1 NAD(P)H nitroreductase [Aestuariibacter halophilus]